MDDCSQYLNAVPNMPLVKFGYFYAGCQQVGPRTLRLLPHSQYHPHRL
jgi:hypothetical protein